MIAPRVSVMISTHNRAGYLREAVASVLAQTFTDFELILCDDASADETPSVCLELERLDSRVRTLRHEQNIGMVQNWNSGLAASRGHYFCKLDDDNRYLDTFLEKTVQALQETPDAAFVFTDEWLIDAEGNRDHVVTDQLSKHYGRTGLAGGRCADTALLAVQQSIGINAAVFVREQVASLGGFRTFAGSGADIDLFLWLARHEKAACYIPERLEEYRSHKGMSTGDLLANPRKAQASVAMWEDYRFSGQAERLRQEKLAQAYATLSRVLLLNHDVKAARTAIKRALQITPTNTRVKIIALSLNLPMPFIHYGLRLRYGNQVVT